MKAYAILAGGGVKGAALAGALSAANKNGINIVGYGGVSAGAIIALLSIVGYSGDELKKIVVPLDFNQMLDDKGESLSKVIDVINKNKLSDKIWKIKYLLRLNNLRKAIAPYQDELGIYSGKTLVTHLEGLVKNKLPGFTKETTFSQLAVMHTLPLRIVASNVTTKAAVIFSAEKTPDFPVLSAVRASVGYPFVFKPHVWDEHHLVDGGLASNTPSFLFECEYRETSVPTLMFDLVSESDPMAKPDKDQTIYSYGFDLMSTALDSSDQLIRSIGRGVLTVDVGVPHGIKTWDIHVTEEQRLLLYTNGYTTTDQSLSTLDRIKVLRDAGAELQRQLIATYGASPIYETVLAAILQEIELLTEAEDVRVCLLVPTDRNTLMVAYRVGFEDSPDSNLELPKGEGAAWAAWDEQEKGTFTIFNLPEVKTDRMHPYRLSDHKQVEIENTRNTLIAKKITSSDGKRALPLAILGIDTSTPYHETGWVDDNNDEDVMIAATLTDWSLVLRKIIEASRL